MKLNKIMITLTVLCVTTLVGNNVLAEKTCASGDTTCCTVTSSDPTSQESLQGWLSRYERTVEDDRWCTSKIEFAISEPVKVTSTMNITQDPLGSELQIVGGSSVDDAVDFDVSALPAEMPVFNVTAKDVTLQYMHIQATSSGNNSPFITIKGANTITLRGITLDNLPAGAIQIEGSPNILIESLTVNGATIGQDAVMTRVDGTEDPYGMGVISVIKAQGDETTSVKITGTNLYNIEGNGIVLKDATYDIGSTTLTYESTYASDTGLDIDASYGTVKDVTVKNILGTGVLFANVNGGTTVGKIEIINDLVSNGLVGLKLDGSSNLSIGELTVTKLKTGVVVSNSTGNTLAASSFSSSTGTSSIVIDSILGSAETNGIVFLGTSSGNLVKQANLNNHPYGCSIVLNNSGDTEIDQNMMYNSDECGVGINREIDVDGDGRAEDKKSLLPEYTETSSDPHVALYKLSQDNLVFDITNTSVALVDASDTNTTTQAELHKLMLNTTEPSNDVSMIGYYDISDLSKTSLPVVLTKTELGTGVNGYYFMVLMQDKDTKQALGVWRGFATQSVPGDEQYCTTDEATGIRVCDTSCYYDPETQSKYRVYNYGVDSNGDGIADDDIDLDQIPDVLEDSTTWTQTKGSDGLWTVTGIQNYSAITAMNCLTDTGETYVNDSDSDGDGIPDGIEANVTHTNPLNPDTDDDDLSDFDEDPDMDGCAEGADEDDCYHSYTFEDGTRIMETNPLRGDSDTDNVSDGLERQRGTNPWVEDSDGDGSNDDTDLCPMQIDRQKGCYIGGKSVIDVYCVPQSLRYENVMSDIIDGDISGETYDCGDADGDGLCLAQEDIDLDCEYDPGLETDASNADSDNDLIADGKEDRNGDGVFYPEDTTEMTSPIDYDSDDDCIKDGLEDKNFDGYVDLAGGETYPNLLDSDSDGLGDGEEDNDRKDPTLSCNGKCDAGETCAYKIDSDGDGLIDGSLENSLSETPVAGVDLAPFSTDPEATYYFYKSGIDVDMDGDGMTDEDTNGNGRFDMSKGECDATKYDTDGDFLPDNYEILYKTSCVSADTDGDGKTDTMELVPGYEGGRELMADELAALAAANGSINHATGMDDPLYFNKGCSLNTSNYQATFGQVMPIIGLMGLAMLLLVQFRVRKTSR